MQSNLILSRKASQTVKVNGPATIEVVRVKGNRVTLSIKADRETKVLRGELEGRAA